MKDLGRLFKEKRNLQRYSKVFMAEVAGVNRLTYAGYEDGKASPSLVGGLRICTVLGITWEELLFAISPPTSNSNKDLSTGSKQREARL